MSDVRHLLYALRGRPAATRICKHMVPKHRAVLLPGEQAPVRFIGSPSYSEEEQGQLPSLLMQSLLSARSAAAGCKGKPSLAKAVTSQLLTLCRGREVSVLKSP